MKFMLWYGLRLLTWYMSALPHKRVARAPFIPGMQVHGAAADWAPAAPYQGTRGKSHQVGHNLTHGWDAVPSKHTEETSRPFIWYCQTGSILTCIALQKAAHVIPVLAIPLRPNIPVREAAMSIIKAASSQRRMHMPFFLRWDPLTL
jgi:hypothetical protein